MKIGNSRIQRQELKVMQQKRKKLKKNNAEIWKHSNSTDEKVKWCNCFGEQSSSFLKANNSMLNYIPKRHENMSSQKPVYKCS